MLFSMRSRSSSSARSVILERLDRGGYYLGNLRRILTCVAFSAVSQHRRSAQALLTLASGCSVTFLLSLPLTNHVLLLGSAIGKLSTLYNRNPGAKSAPQTGSTPSSFQGGEYALAPPPNLRPFVPIAS